MLFPLRVPPFAFHRHGTYGRNRGVALIQCNIFPFGGTGLAFLGMLDNGYIAF